VCNLVEPNANWTEHGVTLPEFAEDSGVEPRALTGSIRLATGAHATARLSSKGHMPYKDKATQLKVQARWRKSKSKQTREILWKAKDKPCADCGIKYPPWVMDFDHVRGVKDASIGHLITRRSTAAIQAEIAKCEVVCSNCHRERTHARGQYTNGRCVLPIAASVGVEPDPS